MPKSPEERVAKIVIEYQDTARHHRDLFWQILQAVGASVTRGYTGPPPVGVLNPDIPELALREVRDYVIWQEDDLSEGP